MSTRIYCQKMRVMTTKTELKYTSIDNKEVSHGIPYDYNQLQQPNSTQKQQ